MHKHHERYFMKTALGYIRNSKDEKNSVSLDYQRREIEKYCLVNDLQLLGIEEDKGISGKSVSTRQGLMRIKEAVKERTLDAVVVFKSDRLSRNGRDSLDLEELMSEKRVAYLSTTEGRLSSETVDDEFMQYIRAGLNQRERKLISLRTKQALARKKEKGERIGGQPKYGWKVVDKELIPEDHEQGIIKRIVKLRDLGLSFRKIESKITEEGLVTRKGTTFSFIQIARILKNIEPERSKPTWVEGR